MRLTVRPPKRVNRRPRVDGGQSDVYNGLNLRLKIVTTRVGVFCIPKFIYENFHCGIKSVNLSNRVSSQSNFEGEDDLSLVRLQSVNGVKSLQLVQIR